MTLFNDIPLKLAMQRTHVFAFIRHNTISNKAEQVNIEKRAGQRIRGTGIPLL